MREEIIIATSNGQRYCNGISSNYQQITPKNSKTLAFVLNEREKCEIIERLNREIKLWWPCSVCYFGGIVFAPCSLGLSLLCPSICISKSQKAAQELLRQYSLKSKFYDNNIEFILKFRYTDSFLVVTFPSIMMSVGDDVEEQQMEERVPFLLQPSPSRRMKEV